MAPLFTMSLVSTLKGEAKRKKEKRKKENLRENNSHGT
jgi:hypothetical protein